MGCSRGWSGSRGTEPLAVRRSTAIDPLGQWLSLRVPRDDPFSAIGLCISVLLKNEHQEMGKLHQIFNTSSNRVALSQCAHDRPLKEDKIKYAASDPMCGFSFLIILLVFDFSLHTPLIQIFFIIFLTLNKKIIQ